MRVKIAVQRDTHLFVDPSLLQDLDVLGLFHFEFGDMRRIQPVRLKIAAARGAKP